MLFLNVQSNYSCHYNTAKKGEASTEKAGIIFNFLFLGKVGIQQVKCFPCYYCRVLSCLWALML